jgi:hypothetical protein
MIFTHPVFNLGCQFSWACELMPAPFGMTDMMKRDQEQGRKRRVTCTALGPSDLASTNGTVNAPSDLASIGAMRPLSHRSRQQQRPARAERWERLLHSPRELPEPSQKSSKQASCACVSPFIFLGCINGEPAKGQKLDVGPNLLA